MLLSPLFLFLPRLSHTHTMAMEAPPTLSMMLEQQPWLLIKPNPTPPPNHHEIFSDSSSYSINLPLPNLEAPPPNSTAAIAMVSDLEYHFGDGGADEDGHDTLMRDPVLDYISDMLMDENMEDRKCMLQECTAYQALMKGFIQDLQGTPHEGYSSQALCADRGGIPQEYSHHLVGADQEGADYSWIDKVLVDDLDPSMLGEYSTVNGGKHLWREGIPSLESSPNSASNDSSQDSPTARSMLNLAEIQASHGYVISPSPVVSPEKSNSTVLSSNGSFNSMKGEDPILKVNVVEPSLKPSPTQPVNAKEEEVQLSFVNNEDLKAEKHAKFYADWSTLDPGDTCTRILMTKTNNKNNGGGDKKNKKTKRGKATSLSSNEHVDLRALLVDCAQAIGANNLRKANEILRELAPYTSPYGSSSQRLGHYFKEALFARLSGTGPRLYTAMASNRPTATSMLKAYRLMVEVCPFSKLSHYFANHGILKVAQGASRLHIVDYGILYGVQWPCLISALADRKGGPPFLRITGIDLPLPGNNPVERIEETGKRLAEYAKTYNVPFEFHAIAKKWEDIEESQLNLKQGEVLVVNCIHRLRHLMDETTMVSDSDHPSARRKVLNQFRSLNPHAVLIGVMNSSMNAPFFVSRFREALYCYSSKFDMMETTVNDLENPQRLMIEREIIGRDILNVVACEGHERVERPETYRQWHARFQRAGFEPVRLDKLVVHKARHAVNSCYHKDFTVDDDTKWMLVGWKGRIVQAFSAWKPSPSRF